MKLKIGSAFTVAYQALTAALLPTITFALAMGLMLDSPSAAWAQELDLEIPAISEDVDQVSESVGDSSPAFKKSVSISDSPLSLIVNVRLASRDAGILEQVNLKEGDAVNEGVVIAVLDSELYNAELNAAQRELAIAEEESENDIDLRYAKVSEQVNRKILDRSQRATRAYAKSVSKTEIEQLRLELERSKLSGEQAVRTEKVKDLTVKLKMEQKSLAQIRLNYREIKSPATGVVTQVYRQPGEWVQSGEPIVRIIGLDRLRVSCRCEVVDGKPSEIGERVAFFPIDENENGDTIELAPIFGTISFVSPEIDPSTQDFEVWAEIDNAEQKLLPGMIGRLEIELK